MKINKRFSTCSKKEYFHILDNRKKYTDFNELGMYRSIIENDKLTITEKIEVRDYAHQFFIKTFNFYQLKDPITYIELMTLDMELTRADEQKIWQDIRTNQQKILQDKRIKHRNFGGYSKHNCGSEFCAYNGVMTKKGTILSQWSGVKAQCNMIFDDDKNKDTLKKKSAELKKQRKTKSLIIRNEVDALSH